MARPRAQRLTVAERAPLILDAALELLQTHDAATLTMDAVAAEAGVAKPSVYNCFDGRDALLSALAEREEKQILALIASSLNQPVADNEPESLVASGLGAILQSVAARPQGWRLVYPLSAPREPGLARRLQRVRAKNLRRTERMCLRWLLDRGAADAHASSRLMSRLLAGTLDQLIELVLEDPTADHQELASQAACALAHGLPALSRTDPSAAT